MDTTSGWLRRFHDVTMGTMARTGVPVSCSAASLVATASSRVSRRKATARPRIRPAARPRRPLWAGFGALGDAGSGAGVTRARPPVVTAPLTCIWASCSLSTACWLSRAAVCEAAPEVLRSAVICLPSDRIWLRSCASAAVRPLKATVRW